MIRPATPHDVDGITSLWNEIISQTTFTFTTVLKRHQDVQSLLNGPWPVLVADKDGQFAGFACLSSFRGGPGYARVAEHTIYLKTDMRGGGLGAALLAGIEAEAKAAGIKALVGAISGTNEPALKFHAKAGFVQVGQLPGIGWKWGQAIDLILMQKNL